MGDFLIEILSNSVDETFELGRRISSVLESGSVVALSGDLGSGKTNLAKGIASGLGIKTAITSPTYTIINEYSQQDSPLFFHIDAYRLNDEKDFEDIGGNEIINSIGICVIEWSERIKNALGNNTINIFLEIKGKDSRLIKINGIEKL